MWSSSRNARENSQRGVALLIAIFALVLISAVGISLILMAQTESGINVNYRRSTTAFYAAQGGLEEGRERIMRNAPDTVRALPSFPNALLPNLVPGQVLYIVNPAPADPAYNPQSDPPTSPYYDAEYQQEFGVPPVPVPTQLTNSSAMTQAGNMPPLPYKWVRITLKSEAMGGVDLNNDGLLNPTIPVLAQGSNNQCVPTIPNQPNCSADPDIALFTSTPVYRVTSFALEPGRGRRLVQAELAELPTLSPNGAIASQADVTLNGNFNALGAWPPIATASCGVGNQKSIVKTCGSFQNGQVVGDCNNPYNQVTDTCNGVPRSHKDYCNIGRAVDGVVSSGTITAGNYDMIPDRGQACSFNKPGCIFTASPQQAMHESATWPYNMDEIMEVFKPPVTEPITDVSGISCSSFDANGNRNCNGQGVQMGSLPNPWPALPNVEYLNNVPRYVYADVGPGGLLKLTGASNGSGLLVVNGDLTIEAGFQWYGLVVARGVVTFLGGGATSTNVYGGVLAGRSISNDNTVTGGSVSIIYSSCAFRNNNGNQPLRYLSFREIPQ